MTESMTRRQICKIRRKVIFDVIQYDADTIIHNSPSGHRGDHLQHYLNQLRKYFHGLCEITDLDRENEGDDECMLGEHICYVMKEIEDAQEDNSGDKL